jgi:hypothetical protein
MGDVEIVSGPPRFRVERIRQVVARACEREGAERAVLFGSYARGDADLLSDVDLIIVCRTSRPFVERFRAFVDVLDAFPGADLLVYTPEEYAALRSTRGFLERAEQEGVELYDAGSTP